MGFNVVLQEFCFHHFEKVNASIQNGGSAQEYRKGMYWPQGQAEENDLLLDYIDAQTKTDTPLYMEGFDPRIFRRKAFYEEIDTLLNTYPALLDTAYKSNFLASLNNLLKYEYNDTVTVAEDQTAFYNGMNTIISNMEKNKFDGRSIQLMQNLLSFSKNAWNPNAYSSNDVDRFFERESQMARNIIWFSDNVYPNQKIIVHLHNGHAAKNIDYLKGSIPDSLIKKKQNVGSILNQRYRDTCLFIATTYFSGTYCKWDFKEKTIPTPSSKSVEAKLHKKGYEYAFVQLKSNRKSYMFHSEFNSWVEGGMIKAPFGKMFDAVIFIDQVYLPTEKDSK